MSQVVATGYTQKNKILKAVRRGGLKADFWSPQNAQNEFLILMSVPQEKIKPSFIIFKLYSHILESIS